MQRGFALLVVLWTMALLSLLATQVTSAGRTEVRLAANLRAQAVAAAAADGAIEEAAFRIASKAWAPDSTMHPLSIGGVRVNVRVEDQGGKINPSRVPRPLMQALLRSVGIAPADATRLALGIEDFRQRNTGSLFGGPKLAPYVSAGLPYGPAQRPYASVDEIGLALGMTPAILERIRPYVSVYQGFDAAPSQAGPAAREALEQVRETPVIPGLVELRAATMLVVVTALATSSDGGTAGRTATVRIVPGAPGDAPIRVLTWE